MWGGKGDDGCVKGEEKCDGGREGGLMVRWRSPPFLDGGVP